TVADLEALIQKYPANPDLPMFASQAKLRLAERARQRDQTRDADNFTKEAVKIIEDALKRTKESDDNAAAMYFSAARVAQAQESLALSINDLDVALKHRTRKKELFAKSRSLAKPDDVLYL